MTNATCKFTFTNEEYRTAYALYRRCRGLAAYKVFGGVMVFLAAITSWNAYTDYQTNPLAKDDFSVWIFSQYAILFIPVLIGLVFAIPLGKRTLTLNALWQQFFSFRKKSLVYNVPFVLTVTNEGLNYESSTVKGELKWPVFSKAMENRDGFIMLTSSRQFHWLPKHGFSSPEDIDHCRALLHDHITDFRSID